jgi:GH15 family glucan-1,4-alpha-glucosidase
MWAVMPESAPHVLREYALLADGERGALIGPRGDLVWMCFPRWHDDPVFSELIGGSGMYELRPRGRFVWGGFYEPGTLIWRSRWATEAGIVECREALAAPSHPDSAVLLRRAAAHDAPARLIVALDLRAGFDGEAVSDLKLGDDGTWRGRVGETFFCWSGAAGAKVERDGDGAEALVLELELEAGEGHDLVLGLTHGEPAKVPAPDPAWHDTEGWWHEQVPELNGTVAPRDAHHAYAVMTGLTSQGGGMVAAATTSLPERADEGRSYDYRYVWLRDQCYAGQAAARASTPALLDAAVGFAAERVLDDGPKLMPAYTVTGEPVPGERRVGLPGYPGGDDVVGNHVRDQFQLDVFGEVLLLFAAAADRDRLDSQGWRAAEAAAAAIEERRRDPDAGVWEIEARHWTHSRMICSAGLRAIASHSPSPEQGAGWLSLADEIAAECAADAVHRSGRWQRAPDDERLDAALLLLPLRGAVAPDDPRSLATLRAVERELAVEGYVYRYQPDERPLGEAEGAFLLCGFLMAMACDQQGDALAALRWFERSRTACGPPALLAEEYDVRQRQLRGNLPQAFVHAVLLESSVALSR